MNKRRVVVTGLGLVTPLGNNVADTWQNIIAGKSGIRTIDHFDVTDFSVKFGGMVDHLDVSQYISTKEQKKMDKFIQYGVIAGIEAFIDSGIEVTENNAERIGVAVGSGIGGIPEIERTFEVLKNRGARRISPFFVPSTIINMTAGHLSMKYGLQGPNYSIVTACATATHNIGDAARTIEYGDADIMLAGGSEMSSCPTVLAGFAAAKSLSTRNDAPERASRPWDRDRDGFVLSDGAGILVLEEYQHAKKRDAKIYAELSGYGMSSDAYHMTAPLVDGSGAARCMRNALNHGGVNADEVHYINAHGTSTPAGDLAETKAIKLAFGDHAKQLSVSSTKSMTGHLLGATGGVEAVFSILSIRDQIAPPTINLEHPDEACDLDYIPNTARDLKINNVLSNSFGFGGTNATLLFQTIH